MYHSRYCHRQGSAARRGAQGFTLVEIMVAVLIMSTILAIAVPNFVQARANATSKTCYYNLEKLYLAKQQWAMDNNKHTTATPNLSDLVGPGLYIKSLPACPMAGAYTL